MNPSGDRHYRTRLISRRWWCETTFELTVAKPDGFDYVPGQRITVELDRVTRDYSLASIPQDTDLQLYIQVIPDGRLSNALAAAAPGTELIISAPLGYLTYITHAPNAVFVATGAGIAPFYAMVRAGAADCMVLHGVRKPAELYHPAIFRVRTRHYIPCISQPAPAVTEPFYAGRVTDYLQNRLPMQPYTFYLCGRQAMIRDATLIIDERFPEAMVYTESFT